MCGIVGQFHFASGSPANPQRLAQMSHALTHRGPDDDGLYLDGPLGLGFRRLSILDLSPAGHQPMSDPSGNVWVVFNGEIYNFLEIRQELLQLGHSFLSHSDTEVIVLGYLQWGDAILDKLHGMFALAIWDSPRQRLLVARDPMGIKPLYYSLHNGTLTFASEIRAVLAGLDHRPTVDPSAIHLFLRYRYTPAPLTAFSEIKKLAPGELLLVENSHAISQRFYHFSPTPCPSQPSDDEAAHTLLSLYRSAVKRHLLSDVPVGLLLSGGLDSGLLLALIAESGAPCPTYTAGYGSSFHDDELLDAAATARHYSAPHTPVHLSRQSFEDSLPQIVRDIEEPIASSSIVPMFFVCQRARQDVTVALVGQGPDELLAGYTRHLGVAYGSLWRRLPAPIRSLIAATVQSLPRSAALKRGVASLGLTDPLHRDPAVFSLLPPATLQNLFLPEVLPNLSSDALLHAWECYRPDLAKLDDLAGLQFLELRSSLPDELLMFSDKLSMAHSLEARVPFLDRQVVEYVQQLGPHFKIRHGQRKWLHRSVCRQLLPPSFLRRKKRGFAVNVVDDWFRSPKTSKLNQLLSDPSSLLYQWINPATVQRLSAEHLSQRHNHHKTLFSLLVFELWLRSYHP